MGARASKPAQTVSRKFPTRAPGGAVPPRGPAAGATQTQAQSRRAGEPKSVKDEAIRADGLDPDLTLDLDARASANPGFSARLHQMGIVSPAPTLSHSSTVARSTPNTPTPLNPNTTTTHTTTTHTIINPSSSSPSSPPPFPNTRTTTSSQQQPNRTLNALEARRLLQQRAEAEFIDGSQHGREFLDAATIRRALLLQNRGDQPADIEKRLRLRAGVVARLGPRGVAVPVEGASLNKQTWGGLHE
ncbi:hypothetical protein F4777DRAFT_561436 [Nemania sp. FL0916]|nr:hypothetical protein F4777DRAFT_561436 [Nemania sp. FL0916]